MKEDTERYEGIEKRNRLIKWSCIAAGFILTLTLILVAIGTFTILSRQSTGQNLLKNTHQIAVELQTGNQGVSKVFKEASTTAQLLLHGDQVTHDQAVALCNAIPNCKLPNEK